MMMSTCRMTSVSFTSLKPSMLCDDKYKLETVVFLKSKTIKTNNETEC